MERRKTDTLQSIMARGKPDRKSFLLELFPSALMWARHCRAAGTCYRCAGRVLIGAGQDYNNHFHFLSPLFHESVRMNSAALYKIRIPQGDGALTYLYII